MCQEEKRLKVFTRRTLNVLRITRGKYDGLNNFWNDIEVALKCKNPKDVCWKKYPGKNGYEYAGDVRIQEIGEVFYKHTVHRFEYIFLAPHSRIDIFKGYNEPCNPKQYKKFREWHVFFDGTVEFFAKDESSSVVNRTGEDMYFLRIRVGSNSLMHHDE